MVHSIQVMSPWQLLGCIPWLELSDLAPLPASVTGEGFLEASPSNKRCKSSVATQGFGDTAAMLASLCTIAVATFHHAPLLLAAAPAIRWLRCLARRAAALQAWTVHGPGEAISVWGEGIIGLEEGSLEALARSFGCGVCSRASRCQQSLHAQSPAPPTTVVPLAAPLYPTIIFHAEVCGLASNVSLEVLLSALVQMHLSSSPSLLVEQTHAPSSPASCRAELGISKTQTQSSPCCSASWPGTSTKVTASHHSSLVVGL